MVESSIGTLLVKKRQLNREEILSAELRRLIIIVDSTVKVRGDRYTHSTKKLVTGINCCIHYFFADLLAFSIYNNSKYFSGFSKETFFEKTFKMAKQTYYGNAWNRKKLQKKPGDIWAVSSLQGNVWAGRGFGGEAGNELIREKNAVKFGRQAAPAVSFGKANGLLKNTWVILASTVWYSKTIDSILIVGCVPPTLLVVIKIQWLQRRKLSASK